MLVGGSPAATVACNSAARVAGGTAGVGEGGIAVGVAGSGVGVAGGAGVGVRLGSAGWGVGLTAMAGTGVGEGGAGVAAGWPQAANENSRPISINRCTSFIGTVRFLFIFSLKYAVVEYHPNRIRDEFTPVDRVGHSAGILFLNGLLHCDLTALVQLQAEHSVALPQKPGDAMLVSGQNK